jgi:hypothetical protein
MELTDEQIANLTPEQVAEFDDNPEAVEKYLAHQEKATEESTEVPEQEVETSDEEDAANGEGEEAPEEEEQEPVVLTKNGKGTIPYEKHKALRVENAELKEQLQKLKSAQDELESLRKQKAEAGTPGKRAAIQAALVKRIGSMKEDFPDVGDSLDAINQLITDIAQELAEEKSANKSRAEAEAAEQKRIIDEQVQEAKENNPDLVYWEAHDEDAWKEALLQDQALMQHPKWAKKSYEERFVEVVKRVRAVMPDASEPPNQPPSAKTQAKAKAKLEKAPERKPTTLSDVHGGGDPNSEDEAMDNLTPHQLAVRLLKMPAGKASAMRARLP